MNKEINFKIKAMKKFIIIVFLSLSQLSYAQRSESRIITIQGNDTTIINLGKNLGNVDSLIESTMLKVFSDTSISNLNRKFEVLIDSTFIFDSTFITESIDNLNFGDTTKIKIGTKKIVIIDDKDDREIGERKIIIDEDVSTKKDFKKSSLDPLKKNEHVHWAGIGIFSNGFLNSSGKIGTKNDSYFLELDYARSIGVNLNLLEKRFPIYKKYIGVTTGLGFQFNHYALKNNVDIIVGKDSTFGVENTVLNYNKNVLRATYLQAPLLLEFNTNKYPKKSWHLSVGVVGGIRIASSLKTKWEDDGKTRKEKLKSNFNLNPFQAYGTAIIGYHNVNLYVNYGLTQIFEKDKGPKFSPVSAGVLFNF
jgi:hypothetical protein